jgi:Asp-tRNA(Asn)/Glu-tRNA(Gln) amidotransferase B subunit
MSETEYKKLTEKYGEDLTQKMIETLNNYKGSKDKRYKSDYHAILNWVVGKVMKEQPKQPSSAQDFNFDGL